jgi:hypothetical protein
MFAWLRQRRWQFSLRFLLGLMLMVAALYGSHLRAIQRQDQAFEKLAAKGFTVLMYRFDIGGTTHVRYGGGGRLMCPSLVSRFVEAHSAPEPFTEADLVLFDDILHLRVVNTTGANLSPEIVHRLRNRYPQCDIK